MALTKISGGVVQPDNFSVGVITATNLQIGSATTIHTTGIDLGSGNITSHNINSTGIITATSFVGNIIATSGTLDVTNIDSVGIITAQSAVSIADSIFHTGDIDTSIRFPAADTFTVETAGSERLRITSSQTRIGSQAATDTTSYEIQLSGGVNNDAILSLYNPTTTNGEGISQGFFFKNSNNNVTEFARIESTAIETTAATVEGDLRFYTTNGNNTPNLGEKLRIRSDGDVVIGIGTDDLESNLGSRRRLAVCDTTNGALLHLRGQSPAVFFDVSGSDNLGKIFLDAQDFAIQSGTPASEGNDRFHITSGGLVGISSSIPNSRLEVTVSDGSAGFRVRNNSEHDNRFQVHARSSGDSDRHTVSYYHKDNYPLNLFTYAGSSYNYGSVQAGRTRSDANSPVNYFRHGAHSFDAYSACTDDPQNYRSRVFMRAWDGGDDGDRNIIYYVNSGSDTTQVDIDAHQKFGVKAGGAVHSAGGGGGLYVGRVESDEGSPNSVYFAGERGIHVYADDSSDETYIHGRNVADTSFVFYSEVNGEANVEIEADGSARTDGTWSNTNADYAEMFEWVDGNTSSEERRGMTVVLDGDKIRLATDSDNKDDIIGVVSANPVIVGDSASMGWHGRYKKDAFDAPVRKSQEFLVWYKEYHMVDGVKTLSPQPDPNNPKTLNKCSRCKVEDIDEMRAAGEIPDFAIENNIRYTDYGKEVDTVNYDPTKTYVPRIDRKEWDAIGLVGKLVVKRGQPVGSRWIKMKDVNEQLEKWLVR